MQWTISKRPRTLGEMAGAEKIKNNFYKLIKDGKDFPKSIMLQGLYGSGKTTASKILAQMLVCKNPAENGDPCSVCPSCRAIVDETFNRDVIQLDAAANGKLDDVSKIKDFIATPPMQDKVKVVLLEEAQELSADAMKAFLKMIETPRKGIHFIMTTMVGHGGSKIPPALVSRSQRYIFPSASVTDIMMYLKGIMESEGLWGSVDIPKEFHMEGLQAIAYNSDGSYRQALQLLEQCIDSQTFTPAEIRENFGITNEADFYPIMLGIANRNLTENDFQTLLCGDANKLAKVFAFSYKVISDTEAYRLFKKVPANDGTVREGREDDWFLRQARELSAHPKFPIMRDAFKHFAEVENLSPSHFRLFIYDLYEKCGTPVNLYEKCETSVIRERAEVQAAGRVTRQVSGNGNTSSTTISNAPAREITTSSTPAPTGRRIIRT